MNKIICSFAVIAEKWIPKDIRIVIPQIYKCIILHSKKGFVDAIKLRILWWREITLDYPSGSNAIPGILMWEREEDEVQSQNEIGGCYTAGSEGEEKGLESRNAGSF